VDWIRIRIVRTKDSIFLSSVGTSVLIALLYHPRMIDDGGCGAVGGMRELIGKTKVLGGKLSQGHFVHHKSHMT
jgi:hypothetical protein